MMHRQALLNLVLLFTASTAQILTTGNTALPACGQTCAQSPQTPLQQAIAGCDGLATPSQQWSCFCQSAFLKPLYNSADGICDAFCTDAGQKQQVKTWYTGNCGTDFGASEHAGQAAGQAPAAASSSATDTAQPTQTEAATTTTGKPKSTGVTFLDGSGSSDNSPIDGSSKQSGSWLSNHYQYIIMLVVIAIGLGLFVWLMIWLRKRHERRQDAAPSAFNEGITMRSAPMTSTSPSVAMQPGSGRDSPARTRDAFMPYGYGYSRSESGFGSRTNIGDSSLSKGSPLVTITTAGDLEKETGTPVSSKKKRIYVRERSMADYNDLEKR